MAHEVSVHAVVIAGGSGTRFWPLSRRSRPKQLLNLSGEGSLLAGTFARVAPLVPPQRQWMVVGEAHADGCRTQAPQLPDAQVLVEPVGRNTAPAIALAAVHLLAQASSEGRPEPVMAVLPADHHVADRDAFCAALSKAATLAAGDSIVTLGISPTHPETGYGYVQRGAAHRDVPGAFLVSRFCEKPDLERAREFLEDGAYDWNAGIFVMRPSRYLEEVELHLPALHEAMAQLRPAIGTPGYEAALAEVFDRIEAVSIDYGVMEKAGGVAVVPVACGWSDVGSWSALKSVVAADADGNAVCGRAVLREATGCTVFATEGHAVGVVGLKDVVVVHTPDATLVVPAQRAQQVREIIDEVGERGWTELL